MESYEEPRSQPQAFNYPSIRSSEIEQNNPQPATASQPALPQESLQKAAHEFDQKAFHPAFYNMKVST